MSMTTKHLQEQHFPITSLLHKTDTSNLVVLYTYFLTPKYVPRCENSIFFVYISEKSQLCHTFAQNNEFNMTHLHLYICKFVRQYKILA